MYKKNLLGLTLMAFIFIGVFTILPTSQAHILIIGDSQSDYSQAYDETSTLAATLKSKGYDVVALYRENATSKNILKGMYNADAVIYAGHGGYQSGNYNMNGGNTTPPFALVGSDDFIWGIGDKMREGWDGNLFTAPFKQNIPVILLHACFSTGWVEDKEVANPIQTIYNFAKMFNGAGANYYATAYNGAEIVYDFLNGAANFESANNQTYGTITTSTVYDGTQIWRNSHGYSAFVGNWSGKFPSVAQTTAYNDTAAEKWYDSGKTSVLTSKFTISNGTYYVNQLVTFTDASDDIGGYITNYSWDFGDKNKSSGTKLVNVTHTYLIPGNYTIMHTVTDNSAKNSSISKTIQVVNQSSNPRVNSSDPVNKAVNVPVNKIIKVTFNKPIKVGSNWIELKNSKGTLIYVNKTVSSNILTITPINPLKEDKYTLILHTGSITDLAGNPLALWSSSFSVGTSPTVKSVDPVNKAVNVPVNKTIKITFSEPIKAGSLWIELKTSSGTVMPIKTSTSSNILTVAPTVLLNKRITYTLILHTGSITDLAGNPLALWGSTLTTGAT